MRLWLTAALVLAAVPAGLAQGPRAAASPVRLVRCVAGRDLPCLIARVVLTGAGAASVAALDSAAEAHAWTGVLGGARLIGPGVVVPRRIDPPLRLLVLLDRSGSMIGEGIAFTRITLRGFILSLDSATTRVAVAGFESRDVARGIQAARFVAPAEAARILQQLPAPDPTANTALYSGLVNGLEHLGAARTAAPGTQGALLLVTDGRNDVGHPRDDPDLLAGELGLKEAAAAAAASGAGIWIMGVGEHLSASEISTLAGTRGSATTVSLDPNAMSARLSAIARELRGSRDLTFGVSGGAASALARAPWAGTAAAWSGGKPVVTEALAWRPPLFALPAYEGVAEPASLPAALRDAGTAAGALAGLRWLMAGCLVLFGGLLWFAAPRYLWRRDEVLADTGLAPAPSRRAPLATSADTSGLRRDLQEAPPRRPEAITAEYPAVSASSTPSRPDRET